MMTLQQIRDAKPCLSGWRTLLESLGGNPPMDTAVSLGDIARSNGASDTFWAIRCANWSAIRDTMRNRVLNPMVVRAATAAIRAADYAAARAADYAARAAAAACAARAAACAARAADAATDAADYAARAAAACAAAARDADYACAAAARDAEREKQRADIIAAFPPLHS